MDNAIRLLKSESTFFTGWLKSKKLGLALIYSATCALTATEIIVISPWAAVVILGVGSIPVSIYILVQGLSEREAVKSSGAKPPVA